MVNIQKFQSSRSRLSLLLLNENNLVVVKKLLTNNSQTHKKMITITLTSKLGKVGHKNRTFKELVSLSPEIILEKMKKDNRLVLDENCEDLLNKETRKKGVIKYILSLSIYRKEREILNSQVGVYISSENLSKSYTTIHPHGILLGIRHGY